MKSILFLSLFILMNTFCSAQNNTIGQSKIKNLNPDKWKGIIYLSLKARNGDLWFGSTQGVYRYDGKLFYNYTTMDGLNTTAINCMIEDKNGTIWFGVKGGACKFDGKKFSSLLLPNSDGSMINQALPFWKLQNNETTNAASHPTSVMNVMQDKNGVFWFGVDLKGVYRYDGKNLTNVLGNICQPVADNIANGTHQIFQDANGNIWFNKSGCGSCHFLFKLDAANTNHPCINNTCKHDLKKPEELIQHNQIIEKLFVKIQPQETYGNIDISTVLADSKGNVWLGTWNKGVLKYDGKQLTNFSTKNELKTASVSVIYEDKKGTIWFGTDEQTENNFKGNGLFCFDGKSITHFTTKDGLCSNATKCITEDNAGNIWLCSEYYGVSVFDGKTFTNYSTKDGLFNETNRTILKDKNGNIWFGSYDMGLTKFDGKVFTSFTEK